MKELLGHGVLPIPPQGINGREGVEPATSVHKRKEKKNMQNSGPIAHAHCLSVNYKEVLHGELCEGSPALLFLLYLNTKTTAEHRFISKHHNTSSSRAKSRPSHVQVGPSQPAGASRPP